LVMSIFGSICLDNRLLTEWRREITVLCMILIRSFFFTCLSFLLYPCTPLPLTLLLAPNSHVLAKYSQEGGKGFCGIFRGCFKFPANL
jgi:hypothetical protein